MRSTTHSRRHPRSRAKRVLLGGDLSLLGSVVFSVILSVVLGAVGSPAHAESDTAAPAVEAGKVVLKHKTERRYAYEHPGHAWKPLTTGFDFSAGGGPVFAAEPTGMGLQVDKDGDGTFDVTIEGNGGLVAFASKDGAFRYAARLMNRDGAWFWRTTSTRRGTVLGQRVQIIDADGDGQFGEVGEDAVVIGTGKVGSYFSPALRIGNALLSVTVAKDGSSLEYAPYKGRQGSLDMTTAFTCNARLTHLVVRDVAGVHSFELSAADGPVAVPTGQYTIDSGAIGLGDRRVRVRQGRMKPFLVKKGGVTKVAWGGSIRAEFDAVHNEGKVHFDPRRIWYFGQGGEEYVDWTPLGKSPEFTVLDNRAKEEVAKAIFTGT